MKLYLRRTLALQNFIQRLNSRSQLSFCKRCMLLNKATV